MQSQDLFNSLPRNTDDLEILDKARELALSRLKGGSFASAATYLLTTETFGSVPQQVDDADVGVVYPSWKSIFGSDDPNVALSGDIPLTNKYFCFSRLKVQPSKAADCAKGLEATMTSYYRSCPGIHYFNIGIGKEPDTVLMCCCAESKRAFDSLPSTQEELEQLNVARAPYMMMVQEGDGSIKTWETANVVGSPF